MIAAAKAADKLLSIDGVTASFAICKIDGVIHISARSVGIVNVQLVATAGVHRVELFLGGGEVPCLVLRPDLPSQDACLVPDAAAGSTLWLRAVAFDLSGDRSEVEVELVVTPGIRIPEDDVSPAEPDRPEETE